MDSTLFDQIYSGYRRRPAMISLNVQWLPVDDRSGTYQWNGNDANNRKVKTVTFFGTGERRGQQTKAVTPPGSDYTDAYLSAFAAKPIPTRHVHRLNTAILDKSTPIPLKPISTPLSISSSIKTSQTRFVSDDNIQRSDSFERFVPSPSDRSSTNSPSFVPERPTNYKPFSSTQYSSPQSQTFTSSYSTVIRTPTSTLTTISTPSFESQRSYTSFPPRPQPYSPTYTPIYRSESSYESIYKPMPAYSLASYPPSNTYTTSLSSPSTQSSYKPYVPFQPVPSPSSSSYNSNQSSTAERTTPTTSKISKPVDRPETLLFQHDEDLRSSRIEKPSPLITPSPQSPLIREEAEAQSELSSTENSSSTTSEPIRILESTLSKYDSLINQISEVLASVSPLSSTVSSMSPGKSALDYQLSSDSSPTVPHRPIDSQSTSATKSADTQRTKQSHLIRDDSYEKIVTAISDLDKGMISPSDAQRVPSPIKEEETGIPSHDEPQLSSTSEDETLKSNVAPSETGQEKEEDTKIPSTVEEQQSSSSVTEEETKTSSSEEHRTSPVSEDEKKEEPKSSSTENIQVPSAAEEERNEQLKEVPEDENQVPPSIKEEKKEEIPLVLSDESSATSTVEDKNEEENVKSKTSKSEEREETEIPLQSEQQTPSESDVSASETKVHEEKLITEEQPTVETAEFIQQQTGLLTDVPSDLPVIEELTEASIDESSNKKAGKHVTWDETVVDNEEDESSSHQSPTGERSIPEISITTAPDDSQATTDQQLTSSDVSESQTTSEQIDEPSAVNDQQVPSLDSAATETTVTEQQISPSNDLEDETTLSATPTQQIDQTSTIENESAPSASTDQQTTSSDTTEAQVSLQERQKDSTSPSDAQSISTMDSPKKDTLTIDELSTTTSDVINNEDGNEPLEQTETRADEDKADTSSQVVESAPLESETVVTDSTTAPLELVINSPIDTLTDTVSNRYVSSDVYHGYLGDRNEFSQDSSDVDDDSTKKSLLASLRETITTPITPLIETIQSVVSSMQTTSTPHPSKSDSDVTDHPEDATSLTAPIVTEPTEEDQSIVNTAEQSKTIFENLREAFTAPITAISEILRSDQHKELSNIEPELSSNVVSSSEDQSNKEIEQTQSSLLENIPEKVSQTITSPTETIQNVVSTNDEQAVHQEKSDVQSLEFDVPLGTAHDETADDRQESPTSFITDTTTSTSSDSSSTSGEQTEKQGAASEESIANKTLKPTSDDEKTEELAPAIQQDEQVSAASPTTLEQVDSSDKSATLPIESSSAVPPVEPTDLVDKRHVVASEVSNETSTDMPAETKTTLETIRDVITHPIATITEKLQSIIPGSSSEQVVSETTETAKEHPTSETENTETIEEKSDSITEASETKSTFETIRDAITHPITTITEKIQSVVSKSSSDQVEQALNEPEQSESSTKQSSVETENANISEEKLDSTAETEKIESTEFKTTLESIRDAITHPIATITEKLQSIISPSTSDEIPSAPKEISASITDQNNDETKPSIVTEQPSDTITTSSIEANETVEDVVSNTTDRTSSSQANEQIRTIQGSPLYAEDQIHGEQETSSIATSSPISDHEKTKTVFEQPNSAHQLLVETVRELINDTINNVLVNLNQDTIENELTDEETFTWNNLAGEKTADERLNQSNEPIKPALEEAVQSSDNITTQVEDVMQKSTHELESDSTSATTEIEKVPPKLSTDHREASPLTAEDDSLELINALQGHSIILPSSPPAQIDAQNLLAREKSSSSTTSSQVTSSDRYVSYAIHEMGDSSQERLPSFPLAADIPIYQLTQTTPDENREEQVHSEPLVNINQNQTKDDDLTELDATENLTSYSDDVLIQKLQASAPHRLEHLDASSTDEDVDDEFEQSDVSNLHRIIEQASQHSPTFSGEDGQTYQRYDLSSTSSTSAKPPTTDDVYIIPGYPGLWRPSADDLDDDRTQSPFANDADDEDEKNQSTGTVKTRTIVRTTDPARLQSFFQQSHDIPHRPETIDVFNRPLNEFPFELSESDSFKTCASTLNSSSISKAQKIQSELFEISPREEDEHQASPDEKIFLIRERERGVSLPVTMKIDYDDMALRLSASTPIDAQLYETAQTDLPSPSTHSEPIQKTTSSSRASTPSISSNESEQQQQKPSSSSSWLNTVNTITTTSEGPDGPLESRTTIHKSSKGPISVAECDAQGKYVVIENTSRSKSIALASWTLRQENDAGDVLTFTFPDNCLLRPNHSLKVLTKVNESERRNSDLIASSLSSWHTGSNVITTLINADGKDRASLTKKTLFS